MQEKYVTLYNLNCNATSKKRLIVKCQSTPILSNDHNPSNGHHAVVVVVVFFNTCLNIHGIELKQKWFLIHFVTKKIIMTKTEPQKTTSDMFQTCLSWSCLSPPKMIESQPTQAATVYSKLKNKVRVFTKKFSDFLQIFIVSFHLNIKTT